MRINLYQDLIQNLPVKQQSFTTKRTTWRKAEKDIDWLSSYNDSLFSQNGILFTSRQDIFNSKKSITELVLKTIYWGYTRGMRGNHFVNILKNLPRLESILLEFTNNPALTVKDFIYLVDSFKDIPGLGLSTYSKILYFLKVSFNNNPCLILDQRLIDVFASEFYMEYSTLKRINYSNAESYYLDYLAITKSLANDLKTDGENIELFLFIFGNNLKITP
jgi:hypothetical protein